MSTLQFDPSRLHRSATQSLLESDERACGDDAALAAGAVVPDKKRAKARAAWISLGLLTLSGIAAGIVPAWRAASLPIAVTLRQDAVA